MPADLRAAQAVFSCKLLLLWLMFKTSSRPQFPQLHLPHAIAVFGSAWAYARPEKVEKKLCRLCWMMGSRMSLNVTRVVSVSMVRTQ